MILFNFYIKKSIILDLIEIYKINMDSLYISGDFRVRKRFQMWQKESQLIIDRISSHFDKTKSLLRGGVPAVLIISLSSGTEKFLA